MSTDGPHQDPSGATAPVSFREALKFWFWLGCISFGGPAAQIALMHEELVAVSYTPVTLPTKRLV